MTPTVHAFIDASVGTPVRPLPPAGSSAIATEDWNTLFEAVRSRLNLSADAPAERVTVVVLECVQALDQLQAMLAAERSQSTVTSLHALVIGRFVRPHITKDSEASARKFTNACSRAEPLRL